MTLDEADKLNETIQETLKNKNVSDLSEKHFSRFGEFVVSFELSKYGWNIYSPVYDEYIDFVIHKYTCKHCNSLWNHTPALICQNCGKDFSKSNKNKIGTGICLTCGSIAGGNPPKCKNKKCSNPKDTEKRPTCDVCKGEVEMRIHKCDCGSTEYDTKIRTIQVKSSRIEFNKKTGKSKNTYAVDLKPKDLIQDDFHFYIWCLIDDVDKPHFLVLSVQEFINTMGDSLHGISFFKDQDRQHFSAKDFGKWGEFHNRFDKLE